MPQLNVGDCDGEVGVIWGEDNRHIPRLHTANGLQQQFKQHTHAETVLLSSLVDRRDFTSG